jgi:hypothetical protein
VCFTIHTQFNYLIKRELLVFILIQWIVGKPLKYKFDVERILAAMTNVDRDPSKAWRAVNGFGGKVGCELGLKNKRLVRKNYYQRWFEDRKGLRSQYTNTMCMMEWNATPEVLAMDVSNLFKPKAKLRHVEIINKTILAQLIQVIIMQ